MQFYEGGFTCQSADGLALIEPGDRAKSKHIEDFSNPGRFLMASVRQTINSRHTGVVGASDQRGRHHGHSGRSCTRLVALFKQRCPRCLRGQVFAGLVRMHAFCPTCGLRFEREPGYFTGAMYLSYGLGLVATVPVWLPMVWARRSVGEVLLASSLVLLLGSPWLFRYSRLLWLYLDHALDPR